MMILMLYDGTCAMCHGAVQATLKYDEKEQIYYAPLDSPIGKKILKAFAIPVETDSLIVVDDHQAFLYGDAILALARALPYPLRFLVIGKLVPRSMRDFLYRLLAKYRYRLFGKETSCRLYPASIQRRFLYDERLPKEWLP